MDEYYVIHPTNINKKKVTIGETAMLTKSQGRPLVNGGFVTRDKGAADRILKLTEKVSQLETQLSNSAGKDSEK